jgi:hypothetical protein
MVRWDAPIHALPKLNLFAFCTWISEYVVLRPPPNRLPRLLADLRGKTVHKIPDLIDRP